MRVLLILGAVLAAGWGGLWFAAARTVERGVETWFAEQAAAGMVAEYDFLAVNGFPGRIVLTVEGPRFHDPFADTGWQGPEVLARVAAWRPGRLEAELASPQRLRLPGEDVEIVAETLQGSVTLSGLAMLLQQTDLTGRAVQLAGESGWTAGVAALDFASRADAAEPERQRLRLEAREIALPLPDVPRVPATAERLEVALSLTFDAPLDRHMGDRPAELRALELEGLEFVWGAARLTGDGTVVAREDGLAEGRIAFRATDWRALLEKAVATGAIRPEIAPTWERVFETLERAGGTPGVLVLPLTFQRGRTSLGPLPLGPAPRLAPPR